MSDYKRSAACKISDKSEFEARQLRYKFSHLKPGDLKIEVDKASDPGSQQGSRRRKSF